ncbi:MAG: entericidin A/B family lipoprotein [Paracoccaceae bacterium]|nr:entericidin A/B family lipoprotein [Paracoccaceae bacterium]
MPSLKTSLITLAALLALAACETVQGAGRDLQSAGQAVTAESRAAQKGM